MQIWGPPNSLSKEGTQNLFRDHYKKIRGPQNYAKSWGPRISISKNGTQKKLGAPQKLSKIWGPNEYINYSLMGLK